MVKRGFYEVEAITKMKVENGKRFFRVKWVGYQSTQSTWQPQENFNEQLIKKYFEKQTEKSKYKNDKKKQSNEIIEMKIVERRLQEDQQGYEFVIIQNNKKKVVDRNYLYTNHSSLLAKFYLGLYLQKKNSCSGGNRSTQGLRQ